MKLLYTLNKMNKLGYFVLGFFLQLSLMVHVSGQTISGTVISEFSEPLAGASIRIPHTNIGTVTDSNGNYSITMDSIYNILRYSYIGFEDKYHTIENDTIVNITLERSPIDFKEIIIYGPQINIRKRCHSQIKTIKRNGRFKKPDTIIVGMPDSTFNRIEAERISKAKDSINEYIVPLIIPQLNDSINFTKEIPTSKFSIIERAIRKYIVDSIKYPREASENGICGIVYANFVINENNKITDVKIIRGIEPVLDNEVISVLKRMPNDIQMELGEMGYYYERQRHLKYMVKIKFLIKKIN